MYNWVNTSKIINQLPHMIRVKDWSIPLFGIVGLAWVDHFQYVELSHLSIALIFNFLYLSYGFLHNNLTDISEDKADKNCLLDPTLHRASQYLVFLCSCSCLLISWFYNFFIETLLITLLNTLYSNYPFRLKNFLIPSIILNALFFMFIYYSSALIFNQSLGERGIESLYFIFSIFCVLQYIHFLEHLEEDNRISKNMTYGFLVSLIPLISFTTLVDQKFKVLTFLFISLFATVVSLKVFIGRDYKYVRGYARNASVLLTLSEMVICEKFLLS